MRNVAIAIHLDDDGGDVAALLRPLQVAVNSVLLTANSSTLRSRKSVQNFGFQPQNPFLL